MNVLNIDVPFQASAMILKNFLSTEKYNIFIVRMKVCEIRKLIVSRKVHELNKSKNLKI